MAQRHTAVVVGAGSQGWVHARAYRELPAVDLAAVVDLDQPAAERLAAELGARAAETSYLDAIERFRPDVLSVCTPAASHVDIVRAAVEAGVRAIHCEKPMAKSYGDASEMVRIATDAGVQLTVNLQRRFDPVHRFARDRIAAGAIGTVVSVEGYCPNLADWGAHIVDLAAFYLGDAPITWVMSQLDVTMERYVYGVFAETSSVTLARSTTGANVLVFTGREPRTPLLNLENQLGLIVQGSEGRIDARGERCTVRVFGEPDEVFETPFDTDTANWERGVDPAIVAGTRRAIDDLLAGLEGEREPELAASHALAGAEVIFASYESSLSRRRVDLPLERHDSALLAGVAQGAWAPVGELRSTY